MRAPFLPLVGDAENLDLPADDARLRARMAEIYGVTEASVLPVQGALQAVDLLMRRVARDGATQFTAADAPALRQLAKINGLTLGSSLGAGNGGDLIASPDAMDRRALTTAEIRRRAAAIAPALFILDETLIEFEDVPSAVALIGDAANLAVIRSLELAYGLTGAPCAAIIAAPALIARLEDVKPPGALPTPIVRLALAALAPARVAANTARIAEIRAERTRLAAALPGAQASGGPYVLLRPEDTDDARATIRRHQIEGAWCDSATFLLAVGAPDANDRALSAFGAATGPARRRAEVVRETKETQIVVRVDLDREGPCAVQTGVGFFDHMLSQIALHGGFTLTLACDGDLEVDAHHTIEDCALALGQAMKQALGARKGISRFGFLLPMDEAEAQVSIDLSGRPYLVFDGAFDASHIGAYPTEMTEHVFRSLAQSMGAAIHIRVSGANDHHKTEACFKSFGRALRQALRVEGEAMPSTKGVL